MADPQKLADALMQRPALRYGYTADTAPSGMRWAYEALARQPGTQYGDVLPVARDANGTLRVGFVSRDAQGNYGLAVPPMPNALREGIGALADLLSGVDTGEVTRRGAQALTLGSLGTAMTMAERGALGMGGSRLYHGTVNKDAILREGFKPSRDGAVYLSNNPLEALEFGRMMSQRTPGYPAPKVISAELSPAAKIAAFDAAGETFAPEMMAQYIADARLGGADVAHVRNIQNFEHGPTSDTYAVLNPDIIEILRKYGLAAPAPLAAPSSPGMFNLPNNLRRPEDQVW